MNKLNEKLNRRNHIGNTETISLANATNMTIT